MAAVHLKAFEYAMKTFLPDSRYVYQHFIFNRLVSPPFQEDSRANDRLHAMESSFSWRITKPFRWLGDRVRRLSKSA
jgi:hypothetical protein